MLLAATAVQAQIIREVDFTRSGGTALNKNTVGGFCPQKWLDASQIYSMTHVLSPLSMPFNCVNLPNIYEVHILSDGTWKDSSPSQKVIFDNMRAAGMGIHVKMEAIPKGSGIRGDADKTRRLFNSSYDAVKEFSGNADIYYEILNEPELSDLEWGYASFDAFWKDFKNAYIALAAKRTVTPRLKIGGPGFANTQWLIQFVNRLKLESVKLDFISFHYYLDWRDAQSLDQYNGQGAIDRMNSLVNGISSYKSIINPNLKLFCTEFNWTNGDGGLASGYCKVAQNGYKNCARSLEALKLIIDQLGAVDRFYWAQSVGQKNDFFTLENYDASSGKYAYRSGYYAHWMFNSMASTRRHFQSDSKIGGLASSNDDKHHVTVWNRSDLSQILKLNIKTPNASNTYSYRLHIIDASTFSFALGNNKMPHYTTGTLSNLGTIFLASEATAYIEILPGSMSRK